MFLEENQSFYVHNCNFAKETRDTLEMIYEVSLRIE